MDAERGREALEPKSVTTSAAYDAISRVEMEKQYRDMLNTMNSEILSNMVNTQPIYPNTGAIFNTAKQTSPPVATILSKDMTDFFNKRDDLLRETFLDKLAGDMSKWKFASANSSHQVVIKGPKGWSIVGNQNEGQLMHDSKVLYRATSSEYQALKPMAVSVVQVIQKAMDAEIERLKTSLVEDLDKEDTDFTPTFLVDSGLESSDIKPWTNSAKSNILRSY